MKYFRGLAIDNGGSEIRVLEENASTENIVSYDNNFKRINESDFRVKETEDPFEVVRITKAPREEYLGVFAHGATARLYEGKSVLLSNQSKKTESIEYYMQLVCNVAKDAGINDVYNRSFEELEQLKAGRKGIFDLGRKWEYVMTIVIPIAEYSGKNDRPKYLREMLEGEYEVEFPLVKGDKPMIRSFSIKGSNIGVLPEGGVVVSGLKNVIGENDFTITFDLGHVSLDLALWEGKKPYGSTVITSTKAGSVLLANCKAALADAGYVLNDDAVIRAMETGVVKSGIKEEDVSGIIKAEKELYAHNYLAKDVLDLLLRNGASVKQIQNVVPVGASFNSSIDSPTGDLLDMSLKAVDMTDVNVLRSTSNLRYANVIQAQQFLKVLMKRVKIEASKEYLEVKEA